jgi:hypothetical protein
MLDVDPSQPFSLLLSFEVCPCLVGESQEELCVEQSELPCLALTGEPLARVLADRLEHPVALVRETDQALLDERLQRVEVGVRDLLGGFEGAAPGEHGESSNEALVFLGKKVVAPGDRRTQRLLACIGVPASPEQIESLGEAFEDLRRGERFRAGGGELDRERQVVEASAELGDLSGTFEPGALAEERDRLGRGEWRHLVLDLPLDAKELAARHEQGEARAALEESRKLWSGLDHLLQVVEEEEHLPLADVLGETVLGAQGLGDRLGHESGIAQGGEPDPEDSCFVAGDEHGRRLEREAGLPRAAGPGQGEQARSLGDLAEDFLQLSFPADEGGGRAGKVRVRDRLEGREALLSELVDGNRLSECL